MVNTTPDGSTEVFSSFTSDDGTYELTVTGLPQNSTGTLFVNAEAIDYEPSSLPLDYETGNKFELGFELNEFNPPEPPPEP